jgi:P-type conjugative transfer protein TrbJ
VNTLKRRLLAGIAAAPMLLMLPVRSGAVIVECANCSSLAEQLLSDAKQAQQYMTQLQQLQTELQGYALAVQNAVALPQSIWSNVQSDIQQVRNLANAGSVLTGNAGSIMSRLSSAQGYATTAAMTPQQISAQFQQWQTTIGNASNSLGRTLGAAQGQEQNYTALQAAIQAHSQTAAGQMQAIQAGNELAGLTNTQLQQIQATLTAAAQEQATRDLVAADRQAMQDQDLVNFLAPPPLSVSGNPSYGPNTLQ